MPRASKLLTEEQRAIAENNGIPLVTVYKRIQAGWEVEKAVAKPTRQPGNLKREDGLFVDAGRAKVRHFSLPQEWDDKLTLAIANSQMSEREWIERAIIDSLKSKKKQAKK